LGYDICMAAVATKQEILRRVQTRREAIRSLGVERLGLFGSFVRGEQGPQSDRLRAAGREGGAFDRQKRFRDEMRRRKETARRPGGR
jgi:hypothetical protein